MDHQWRPSPTQGNICPICRISHFPFCPQPPHTIGSGPRFPLPPLHHRPGFDPYNLPPMVPPHPSWRGPYDGLNDRRNRYELTADPYGQMTPQSHYAPLPSGHGGSNGFLGDGERNCKRMRVGDVSFSGESSSMVERRLKLIRDHGNLVAAGEYSQETGRLNANVTGVSLPINGREGIRLEDAGFAKNEISWVGMSGMNSQYNGGISRNSFGPSLNEQRIYLPNPSEPSAFNAGPSPVSATPPRTPSSLFPVGLSSSGMPPLYPYASHNHSTPSNPHNHHAPSGFSLESLQPQKPHPQEPKVIDASDIFKMPHRARRPDHIVIILRGFPGSGKSYLAKMLRDLEVENGGSAPRIYSMDDYFLTEVEKVEQHDASNSWSGVRAKRSTMKKVMEYCYEPEMEEAYRASMLKAYKKTLEEGAFTFVIVDDRNLRVADFAQFWAIGKKSGYEVYISEATYKDPEGCAARNVHGFSLDDIHQMVKRWEETPPLYMQLNVKSLLHGDDLEGSGIQEVDMEMEDEGEEGPPAVECRKPENSVEASLEPRGNSEHRNLPEGSLRWGTNAELSTEVVRELGRSKWSDDPEGQERPDYVNRPLSALSGLTAAYSGKKGKSVRWGDEVGDTGFSIAAAKKSSKSSLVIGPGTGYNLKSNPLGSVEMCGNSSTSFEQRRQNVFQERLRAETESFKVVFDRRRHRIGGFDQDEES